MSKPLKRWVICVSCQSLMRMFRSFVLRLSLILTVTAVICLLLMAITLVFQELYNGVTLCLTLLALLMAWLLANFVAQKQVDPELSVEVARVLYPSGAILSIILSCLLSIQLDSMIPGTEGIQHFSLIFVGVGISLFLAVRAFDIKWLRLEEEIASVKDQKE